MTDDRLGINNDTEKVTFEPLLNVYKMCTNVYKCVQNALKFRISVLLLHSVRGGLQEGRDAIPFLLTKFKTIQFPARKVKTI